MSVSETLDILTPLATVSGSMLVGLTCTRANLLVENINSTEEMVLLGIVSAYLVVELYRSYVNSSPYRRSHMMYFAGMLAALAWTQYGTDVPANAQCTVVALITGALLMPLFQMQLRQ